MEDAKRHNQRVKPSRVLVRIATAEAMRAHYLKDLSEGGLFLRVDRPLPLGSEVVLELVPPGWDSALPLAGRVVRVADDDAARASGTAGMALRFENLDAEIDRRLKGLIGEYAMPGPAPTPAQAPAQAPTEVDRLRMQIQGLVFELGAARESHQADQTRFEDERQAFASAQAKVEQLARDNGELAARCEALKAELAMRLVPSAPVPAGPGPELEMAIAEIATLRTDLADAQSQMQSLRKDIENLEQDEASSRGLSERIAAEKTALERLRRDEADRGAAEIQRARSEFERAKAELDRIHAEFDRVKAELGRAKAEGDKAKGETEKVRGELERARGEADRARGEADRARGEVERVRAEAGQVRGELERVSAAAEHVRGEFERVSAEAEQVRGALVAISGEAEQARAELGRVQGQHEAAQAKAREAEQGLLAEKAARRTAEESAASETRGRTAAEGKAAALQAQLNEAANARAEAVALEGKLRAAQQQLESERARVAKLDQRIAEVNGQLERSKAKERDLRRLLSAVAPGGGAEASPAPADEPKPGIAPVPAQAPVAAPAPPELPMAEILESAEPSLPSMPSIAPLPLTVPAVAPLVETFPTEEIPEAEPIPLDMAVTAEIPAAMPENAALAASGSGDLVEQLFGAEPAAEIAAAPPPADGQTSGDAPASSAAPLPLTAEIGWDTAIPGPMPDDWTAVTTEGAVFESEPGVVPADELAPEEVEIAEILPEASAGELELQELREALPPERLAASAGPEDWSFLDLSEVPAAAPGVPNEPLPYDVPPEAGAYPVEWSEFERRIRAGARISRTHALLAYSTADEAELLVNGWLAEADTLLALVRLAKGRLTADRITRVLHAHHGRGLIELAVPPPS